MYSYTFSDLQTGTRLITLDGPEKPSDGRWATRSNGFESGQHTFQLNASGLTPGDWRDLTDCWRRTIDIEWDGVLQYSGLIMGYNWNRDRGELSVASAEVRTILARRMLFGVGTYANGTKILTGRSLRGLVYQILYYATQGNLSNVWNLPFAFPAFDEPGGENREYWNYLFDNAESMINEVQDADGGPDIHFRPRWSNGRREWEVRVGNPLLSGPAKEFVATGSAPTALKLSEEGDGTQMVTGIFAIGAGSEADMRHGEAATVDVVGSYPSLDLTRQFKSIDDINVLTSHARSEVDTFRSPTRQIRTDVLASEFLPDGLPGSPVSIWFDGDRFIPDGWNRQHCIGVKGDMSDFVTLDLQPA